MPNNSARLTLFVGVMVVGSIYGSNPKLILAQQSAVKNLKHDMMAVAPPKTTVIYDPRLAPERIQYAPIANRVIVEGDIDLGTIDEVRRSFVVHVAALAQLALRDKNISPQLDGQQKEALTDAASLAARGAPKFDDRVIEAAEKAAAVLRKLKESKSPHHGEFRRQSTNIANSRRKDRLWPKGVIPYVIDPDCPNQREITDAIGHWHLKTDRIRLVPLTDGNKAHFKNWVRFVRSNVCSSPVGKIPALGEQTINLAEGCLRPQVIHEIGHTVGLFHEQSRNDRDQFISIHIDNIAPDSRYNFNLILNEGMSVGEFDFKSIMLYPEKAFSANGEPTMSRLDKPAETGWGIATGSLGGTTTELSTGDIRGVGDLYADEEHP